eukprot:TRINITY_DN38577_c0_g4_i1.p1 TRINITY_DN38577_c0_g4~~TRINITY_DN38577_c0_g4_i1.p1  ORF type:complete len:259 (+),score=42.57 TRINITY_DN38577_c0_g4_i1:126-902(+)
MGSGVGIPVMPSKGTPLLEFSQLQSVMPRSPPLLHGTIVPRSDLLVGSLSRPPSPSEGVMVLPGETADMDSEKGDEKEEDEETTAEASREGRRSIGPLEAPSPANDEAIVEDAELCVSSVCHTTQLAALDRPSSLLAQADYMPPLALEASAAREGQEVDAEGALEADAGPDDEIVEGGLDDERALTARQLERQKRRRMTRRLLITGRLSSLTTICEWSNLDDSADEEEGPSMSSLTRVHAMLELPSLGDLLASVASMD